MCGAGRGGLVLGGLLFIVRAGGVGAARIVFCVDPVDMAAEAEERQRGLEAWERRTAAAAAAASADWAARAPAASRDWAAPLALAPRVVADLPSLEPAPGVLPAAAPPAGLEAMYGLEPREPAHVPADVPETRLLQPRLPHVVHGFQSTRPARAAQHGYFPPAGTSGASRHLLPRPPGAPAAAAVPPGSGGGGGVPRYAPRPGGLFGACAPTPRRPADNRRRRRKWQDDGSYLSSILASFCSSQGFPYLVSLGGFEAVAELAESCPDGQQMAVRALVDSGLRHHNPDVRAGAVDALAEQAVALVGEGDLSLASRSVDGLTTTTFQDDCEFIRLRATDAIGNVAMNLIGHENELAARCVRALAQTVVDESNSVRRASVEALGDIAVGALGERHDLAEDAVFVLVHHGVRDIVDSVRKRTVETLGRIAMSVRSSQWQNLTSMCIRALSERLNDTYYSVRIIAARSLGALASSLVSRNTEQCSVLASKCVEALMTGMRGDFAGRMGRLSPRTYKVPFDILGGVALNMVGRQDALANQIVDALMRWGFPQQQVPAAHTHALRIVGQVAVRANAHGSSLAAYCMTLLADQVRRSKRGFARHAATRALRRVQAALSPPASADFSEPVVTP